MSHELKLNYFEKKSSAHEMFYDDCKKRCCTFGNTPHRTLVGYGNVNSDILIIGESPALSGTEENVPVFSKKSWPVYLEVLKVLNKTPEEVYTTNLIKCSIPNEKIGNPTRCFSMLLQQIQIINPKIIIVLSRKASQFLQQEKAHVLRSKIILCHNRPMSAIYKDNIEEYISQFKEKAIKLNIISDVNAN